MLSFRGDFLPAHLFRLTPMGRSAPCAWGYPAAFKQPGDSTWALWCGNHYLEDGRNEQHTSHKKTGIPIENPGNAGQIADLGSRGLGRQKLRRVILLHFGSGINNFWESFLEGPKSHKCYVCRTWWTCPCRPKQISFIFGDTQRLQIFEEKTITAFGTYYCWKFQYFENLEL